MTLTIHFTSIFIPIIITLIWAIGSVYFGVRKTESIWEVFDPIPILWVFGGLGATISAWATYWIVIWTK